MMNENETTVTITAEELNRLMESVVEGMKGAVGELAALSAASALETFAEA
jgi:hypothetical protein